MTRAWQIRLTALAVMACTACGPAASAQVGAGARGTRTNQTRKPVRNFNAELKTLGDQIGTAFHVKVLVDPAIFVAAQPATPANSQTVEAAMTAVSTAVKNTAWRRVYLLKTDAAAIQAPAKIAAAMRALDLISHTGLVVEDTATRRATWLGKNINVGPELSQNLTEQQYSSEPLYVIYSTSADTGTGTPQERMLDLQRQQMDLMMRMDPDQMSSAMAAGMQMYMNLDPATRSQFMGNMIRSGIQMWGNMPADQRQQMMGEIMGQIGPMFGGGGQGGAGGGPRP